MRLQRVNISTSSAEILRFCIHLLLSLFLLPLLAISTPGTFEREDLSVKFSLGDETPASFFIGNILKQTSRLDFRPSTASVTATTKNLKMRATLLDTTRGLASRLLHLSDMGDLYTINTIDRDDVTSICGPLECCAQPQCNLTFTAVFMHVESPDDPITVAVNVQLIDTNDNPPTFQDQQFSITIPETTSLDLAKGQTGINGEYSLPRAFDKDSMANGVKKYYLEGHSDYFTLTSPEHECYPCLKVSSVVLLDYENPKHRRFTLELVAIDGGTIPKSGSVIINIFLADLNDNAPVFAQPSEVIRVRENHTYNQAIYTIRATDADYGANGRVRYQFKTQHSTLKQKTFVLNPDTGELFMESALDYEKFSERKIVLEILAYDDGRPALTSSFSLTVVVIDVNDNSPEVVVQQNHTIIENGEANMPALQLLITDVDEVSQGMIECYLENHERLPLRLEGQTFLTVWTTRQLDYEKTAFLDFNLVCLDNADPPRNTTLPLTIKVGNLNDNPPVFYSSQKTPISLIELTLNENERILRPVYLPTVADVDGSSVSFSMISKEKDSPFTVKSDSGAIYLKSPLDYETSKYHEFEILAMDVPEAGSNEPALTSSVKVHVKVKDVNDNAPELKSSSIIPVKPDVPAGYMVSQLTFKDADGDGQQEVSTKLIAQETFPKLKRKRYFALKENGALITLSPLDGEELSVIALTVVATDIDSGNQLSSTVTVAVVVENPGIAETLRVVRPFPGSTIILPVKKIPTRLLKSESLRGINIPFEAYDSAKSKKLVFTVDRRCNGSEFFKIDQNQTSIIKPILTDATLSKLSSIPSGSRLEVILRVTDTKEPTRTAESSFFVEFDWAPKMSSHTLWPADAADAEADDQNDISGDGSWLSSTDNVPTGNQDGGRPFKLSLGNIVVFLLILVFSLAVGFALFAAILWARAKRATSNAAVTAVAVRRSQSPIVANSSSGGKFKRSSHKQSSIWRPGDTNSIVASERLQLTSTCTEQPSEVHYAILTSNGGTVLGELSKTTEASGSSGGPVLAYFDLIVPPTTEDQRAVQQNFPTLITAVGVASTNPENPPSSTPPVNCYLVM
ncbi:Protocadherin beta-11 [Echinococcus granulosus]|uniref:Protocadherin beta-11 n=1 Tax=Echinococcus granulosus TaxID=6210 RepID=U6JGW0_ECHGR|nr:Protocadherin beta-11 [Echinococcus granulosus]EUB61076.1 Protocadherin beta-11 [Echinococcus granulosus]KAH9284108.1 Protocadherin beta-11 [Echinococcus granulosus]CDS21727.1 protocadherin gamma a8 [Echinococcus granulosus]